MNNEEKILEMLTQMNTRMDQMQDNIVTMQTDISDLKETQSVMQSTLTRVALTQENIVLKSIDALAEGQDLTHQRLKDLGQETGANLKVFYTKST